MHTYAFYSRLPDRFVIRAPISSSFTVIFPSISKFPRFLPAKTFIIVDFPAPELPIMATKDPAGIFPEIPLIICREFPFPKILVFEFDKEKLCHFLIPTLSD